MSKVFPRCQITPQADHKVSIQIDGDERARWHYGPQYPRPFFFPFNGPSGRTLTRMGHPGASNHDHHRSVWFAHAKVLGIDFWSDNTDAQIRQKHWLVYESGDDRAILATRLGWYDGHEPKELLDQVVIAIFRPGPDGETLLELQSTFHPTSDSIEFQQSNFGFLAVRVASSISEHFGDGHLTNSEGLVGEKGKSGRPNIFGKQARWIDYSGPIMPASENADDSAPAGDVIEGITYFDHPQNSGFPNHWHVREDGWMDGGVALHARATANHQNESAAGPIPAACPCRTDQLEASQRSRRTVRSVAGLQRHQVRQTSPAVRGSRGLSTAALIEITGPASNLDY